MTEEVKPIELELHSISKALGEVYFIRKDAEDEQKELREEFFQTVTTSYEGEDLAQKTVEIPEFVETENAVAYAEKYNPGWRALKVNESDKGIRVLVEEDPDFKQHSEVISLDPWEIAAPTKANPNKTKKVYGYVVTKTIRSGSPLIDDDLLAEVDPDLYDDVTDFSNIDDFLVLAKELGKSEDWIRAWLAGRGWSVSVRDDLTPKQIEALRPFTYESPKTKALNVRYANEDESGASG